MRKGFARNEGADQNKNYDNRIDSICGDCDKRDSVKGYKKLALVLFFFTAVFLFKNFCFDVVTVSGNSMYDTLQDGELLLVQMQYDSIERGDIVVAKVGHFKVIKRVVGLPKDTIQIIDGNVFINDMQLDEEYCEITEDAGVAIEPFVLSENEYFLMGDNRGGSEDSRVYGGVNVENIRGVAIYRIYPFRVHGELSHGAKGDK